MDELEIIEIHNRTVWPVNYDQCKVYLPTFENYRKAFGATEITLLSLAGVCFVITFSIFLNSLRNVVTNISREFVPYTIILIVIYPIVAFNCFMSMLLPSASVICDTISVLYFSFSAYFLVLLITQYGRGDSNIIAVVKDEDYRLNTAPCCCLCWIKPTMPTKTNLRLVRYFVMQTTVVVPLVLFIQFFIYLEDRVNIDDTL